MLLFQDAPKWVLRHAVLGSAFVGCIIVPLSVRPAAAQDDFSLTEGGFTLRPEIKAGLGGIATGNTNFGPGTLRPDGDVDDDVDYAEGYVLPKIDLSYDTGDYGTAYGAVAGVGAFTRGGDPTNFTHGSPSDIDLDQLYAGWKSGKLLSSSLGDDAIEISGGREYFSIGDGFLVWDGHFDSHGDAAYWLAPRLAFDMAGVVKFNTKPVSGSAFYLEGDRFQDHAELGGLNLEYATEKFGTFGATYFNIFDSDDDSFVRNGMNVADVRAWDIPVPFVSNLTLRGEFAYEWGSDHGVQIDANGWYLAATYNLADLLPWKPTLTYRYSSFTGDDPDNSKNTAFDPLFYYGPGVWGTWYQGEITGEYLLFNSNEIAHMVRFEVSPTDTLTTGLLFFDFSLKEDNYFGTHVSDKHFADEVNLYANWNITDHLYLGVVGGLAWPGAAAKDAFGDDDTYEVIEGQLVATY